MVRLSRAQAIRIAAVISFVLGLLAFILSIPFITLGADALNQNTESLPFFILFWAFIFGIMRLLGAYGTWHNQRWSIVVTILASVGDGLLAAPGILFAPTTSLWWQALTGTLLAVVIIVLCLWRDGRTVTL